MQPRVSVRRKDSLPLGKLEFSHAAEIVSFEADANLGQLPCPNDFVSAKRRPRVLAQAGQLAAFAERLPVLLNHRQNSCCEPAGSAEVNRVLSPVGSKDQPVVRSAPLATATPPRRDDTPLPGQEAAQFMDPLQHSRLAPPPRLGNRFSFFRIWGHPSFPATWGISLAATKTRSRPILDARVARFPREMARVGSHAQGLRWACHPPAGSFPALLIGGIASADTLV